MLTTQMRVVNVFNVPFEQPFQWFRTPRKLMGKAEGKDRDSEWPALTAHLSSWQSILQCADVALWLWLGSSELQVFDNIGSSGLVTDVGLLCAYVQGSRNANNQLLHPGIQTSVDSGAKKRLSKRHWESGSERASWWKWPFSRILVQRVGTEKRRRCFSLCSGWTCILGCSVTGGVYEAIWAGRRDPGWWWSCGKRVSGMELDSDEGKWKHHHSYQVSKYLRFRPGTSTAWTCFADGKVKSDSCSCP